MPQNKKFLTQGEADGLCGLYCIISFLSLNDENYQKDFAKHDLWHLLTLCDQFSWLTPQSIYEGFENYQLRDIFNKHCENRKLRFEAVFLKDFIESGKGRSPSDAANWLRVDTNCARQKFALFLYLERKDHWVMVHRSDSEFLITDSQYSSEYPFKPQQLNQACHDRGLIIVPIERKISRMFL